MSTTWPQIKVGPLLRGELDKRFYAGLFRAPPGTVRGLSKIVLLAALPQVSEAKFRANDSQLPRHSVVVFEGMEGFFQEILRDHELVRERLLLMTRERHTRGLRYPFGRSVSVHVRLGDFGPTRADRRGALAPMQRVPLDWSVTKVRQLRASLGEPLAAYVFSDGTDEELRHLLELPDTHRLHFGSALADLLALSQAHLLVASGSTYSMWASYLGRMPVLWHPGQLEQRLYYDHPEMEIESGIDDFLPQSFVDAVHRAPERS